VRAGGSAPLTGMGHCFPVFAAVAFCYRKRLVEGPRGGGAVTIDELQLTSQLKSQQL
jgi:hypothetical protein